MILGNKDFDLNKGPYIMGILNVTPDSFSDGSMFNNIDKALFHTEQMIKEGADIIDIGGESTRPNHTQISIQEEIDRVAPIIYKIKSNFDTVISLDTYKPEVAAAFIDKIDILNDIWGLKYDEKMAELVAKNNVGYVLMHNRKEANYTNLIDDMVADIKESIAILEKYHMDKSKVIIDAGVGFGKTYEDNLKVINNLEVFNQFGMPQMIATSRKSVIGLTLDNNPLERDTGTAITTAIGILKGIKFLRVHNVKENLDAIKLTNSILKGEKWIR